VVVRPSASTRPPSFGHVVASDETDDEDDDDEVRIEPQPVTTAPGWYVVHTSPATRQGEVRTSPTASGRCTSESGSSRSHPDGDFIEFKGGQRRVVQKKVFPGYCSVRMDLDDDPWYVVSRRRGCRLDSCGASAARTRSENPFTPGLRTTYQESSSRVHAHEQVTREHLLLHDPPPRASP